VTIGQAVFEGRKFFDNLRKGLKYYLAIKAALISILFIPAILGWTLPLAPIQIIVLELFMDLAASAGFVTEPPELSIYTSKPRSPKARFPDSKMLLDLGICAALLFAAVMVPYLYATWLFPGLTAEIQTFAFSAWIMGHIILAFIMRSENEPLYVLGPLSNKVMDLWAILAFGFLFIALTIPAASAQLRLSTITAGQLGLVFIIGFVIIIWREIAKLFIFRRNPKER
jgi:Ca2+-transporting ATPase